MKNYPETMKALVAYGLGDYRLETALPTPGCGPDDIIIKTEGCGICAGDLKCMHGAPMFWGDSIQPGYVKPPFTPGHEFLGRIVALGENVKEFGMGQRVIADQIVPCGECPFCRRGQYWMCQVHNIFGFQHTNSGGMAEYVRLPKGAVVHDVPESLALRDALLIEPYACSKHAVDRAQIQCEDTVVIAGAGTLGLGMVTYARLKNARHLISIDLSDERLEKARAFGADITLNPRAQDVQQAILDLTDGIGCDIYIEATGHPASVIQGLTMIRKLGRFVEFSVFAEPATIDWSIIGDRKELDVLGAHLSPYCFPFAIEGIASGKLCTDGIVTSLLPLEEWEHAFELASGVPGEIKVAISFEG